MKEKEPSYQELKEELAKVKALLAALQQEEVDAIIGKDNVLVVKLRDMEIALVKQKDYIQKLYNAVADAIITVKLPEKIIEHANDSVKRIFGYEPEELIGKSIDIFYASWEEEYREVEKKINNAIEQHLDSCFFEFSCKRLNGESFPGEINISFIREADQPVLAIEVFRDISDRKRSEQALMSANAELALADQRKNEFLAILAHELRNPLAPISTAIEILKMTGPDDPSTKKNINIIEHQIIHIVRLLDDLLDVSRVTRGKINLQREQLDLRTVVLQTIEMARHKIRGQPLQIQYENPSLPVWVNGDFTRLEQIVGNLVNNAVKYCTAGEIIVSLTTGPARGNGLRQAVFCISDTGPGISPGILPHIFELFVQDDQSLDRKSGGLGIGLTMVQWLVKMHGGDVTAQSKGPGAGSIFTVRLPLVENPQVKALEKTQEEAVQSLAADSPPGSRPLLVLIVDDQKEYAESLAALLKIWNFNIEVAYDGPSAIKKALANPPGIMLLDIGLPGMNGYEVAHIFRCEAVLKAVRIIAITGYGQDEARQRSKEAGIDVHLIKPVNYDKLKILLDQISNQLGPEIPEH